MDGVEPRFKGARRKDREAGCREATVEAVPLPCRPTSSYPRRLARASPTIGGTMPSVLPPNEASSLAMDEETYM